MIDAWLAGPNGIKCSGKMCVTEAATRWPEKVRGFNVSGKHLCVSPVPVISLTQQPAASTGSPGSGAPRLRQRSHGSSRRD